MAEIILASASPVRAAMLRQAGLSVTCHPARIDEETIRAALSAEGASPRDQADALAEMKALRLSDRFPDAFVIGCDQILDCDGTVYSKPASIDAARAQLLSLRGRTHLLHSAVVLYHKRRPEWRHLGEARLTMRPFSDSFLDSYLQRNADSVTTTVGAYKIEEEGLRLFSQIRGDHFTILGLPLLPLLNHLALRGVIEA